MPLRQEWPYPTPSYQNSERLLIEIPASGRPDFTILFELVLRTTEQHRTAYSLKFRHRVPERIHHAVGHTQNKIHIQPQ